MSATTPIAGFEFLRHERFSCGSVKNELPVYRCVAIARALGLPDDETDPAAEFVLIPAGAFIMGSSAEEQAWATAAGANGEWVSHEWAHRVELAAPFLLARTPITCAAWMACADDPGMPDAPMPGVPTSRLPMVGISWFEAAVWCDAIGLRLPSEAEWEWACRAGSTTAWPVGDWPSAESLVPSRLAQIAWFDHGTGTGTEAPIFGPQPVGQLAPNAFGLLDVVGNVLEWCEDHYSDYANAPTDGRPAKLSESRTHARVTRGGAWDMTAANCRCASRSYEFPEVGDPSIGLRPACSLG